MYTALYRTERPETFDQVIGQDHIVKILKNQVNRGTVGHAYLFCGTRGTGKTSMARILAKGVNCTGEGEKPCGECANCRAIQNGNFIDVIEIDGASNNGVENVRELRESVNYPPAIGQKKVYIIDEAHELTSHALNALLKTLEEPPENVIFVLATTDPQKLLQTILSRCLRLDFHRVPEGNLKTHMAAIGKKHGVDITEDALNLLAANADGSVRDALSLLDQCLAGADGVLDRDLVLDCLGTVAEDFFIRLTDYASRGDASDALLMLDDVLREGKDVKQILADWMGHYRSLLIGKYIGEPENILNMSRENVSRLQEQATNIDIAEINRGITVLAETVNDARYSPQPRILTELAIIKLAGGGRGSGPAVKATPAVTVERQKPDMAGTPSADASAERVEVEPVEAGTPGADASTKKVDVEPVAEAPIETGDIDESLEDLSDIWDRVWDKIEDIGSVTMVRINSTLAGISDDEFKVLIKGDTAAATAEKHRDKIEAAMGEILGTDTKMIIKKVDKASGSVQESIFPDMDQIGRENDEPWGEGAEEGSEEKIDGETLKAQLENKWNIKVTLE